MATVAIQEAGGRAVAVGGDITTAEGRQAMVDAAKRIGLTRGEAHRLLDTLYDKEGTDV